MRRREYVHPHKRKHISNRHLADRYFYAGEHDTVTRIDRFMALVGKWADIGSHLRWPYRSIPEEYVIKVREEGYRIIPEFFNQ